MDYEDMIEEEPQPAAEISEAEVELETVEARAKSPWKAFILTGVLAGFIGAAGGGYGAYVALNKFAPGPTTQAKVDLSPLESKLNRLTDRLKAAEAEFQTFSNRPEVEVESVDLSEIESRISDLESAPTPEIDPEALTALQDAQDNGFEWPDMSALEGRIEALEAKMETPSATETPEVLMDRLTALETDIETVKNTDPISDMDEEMMSDLATRLSALESRPPPAPVVERVSILAFPKARMVQAVEDNTEGGMIAKTLSRHIRVKDANDPMTLIDGIEMDLSEGRLAAAADKFERLPSPVRTAGQAWYESVKASL